MNVRKYYKQANNENGAVLVLSAIILAGIIVLAGFLWNRVGGFVYTQGRAILNEKVLAITEGGLDKAVWELNQSSSYGGETNTSFGEGTFDITVTNIDSSTKRVVATGYIPDSTNPIAQETVEIEVLSSGTILNFPYGMQAGEEGIIVGQSVSIDGSAYSNGNVVVDSGSSFSGDVWVAGSSSSGATASYETNDGAYTFGDQSNRRDVAVSFVPSSGGDLTSVSVNISKTGNPNHLRVRIMTDNFGTPSLTQVGYGVLDSSWVTSTLSWVDISLGTVPTLTAGTTYWIVLDGGSNSSNYYNWGSDSGLGYSGAAYETSSYAAMGWSIIGSEDLNFRAYTGSTNTSFDGNSGVTVGGDLAANHIQDVTISGDAYYQTITNATAANYYPGSSDPPQINFPVSQAQIDEWKTEAEAGGVHSGDYTSCGTSIGPLKITGNLILWNNCDVTITGTIWVEQIIDLRNGSDMVLDSSFGGNGGIIVTNEHFRIETTSSVQGSGDGDSYMLIVSEGVGPSPVREAIEIRTGDVNVEDAILFAPNGFVEIWQGGATLLELAGKGIELADNVGVVYEQGLANAAFEAGGSSGWIMRDGTWQEQ